VQLFLVTEDVEGGSKVLTDEVHVVWEDLGRLLKVLAAQTAFQTGLFGDRNFVKAALSYLDSGLEWNTSTGDIDRANMRVEL